jgi:hypothetical protein
VKFVTLFLTRNIASHHLHSIVCKCEIFHHIPNSQHNSIICIASFASVKFVTIFLFHILSHIYSSILYGWEHVGTYWCEWVQPTNNIYKWTCQVWSTATHRRVHNQQTTILGQLAGEHCGSNLTGPRLSINPWVLRSKRLCTFCTDQFYNNKWLRNLSSYFFPDTAYHSRLWNLSWYF